MPEMPEVQAHAERMTAALAGATLSGFRLINFAGLKTFNPPADAAVGSKVIDVTRRAKYLRINFDNGQTHVVHLMQGGRIRPDPKQSKKPRNGIVRWLFDDLPERDGVGVDAWLLTEAGTERKAGVWAVDGDDEEQDPLLGLGPDADLVSRAQLAEILEGRSKRLHGLLRQQSVIAGVGRLLANEIIFEAGLSPFANGSKLNDDQLDRLHTSLRVTLAKSLDHERTLNDIGKSADRPSKMHNRAGEPCPGRGSSPCDDVVHTVEYRTYTVFYCPTEQTGGKKLADNTTSKFLK